MFIRMNILIRKFHKCTVAVKTVLFRSYCICLYDVALWSNFHVGMLNELRSSYSRCIKIFFGFNKRDSLTNILFNLGLPSFDILMTNAAVSYTRLWTSCTNSIVMHLRQLSLFSVKYSFVHFPCVFSVFLSVCFLCLCMLLCHCLLLYGPCYLN